MSSEKRGDGRRVRTQVSLLLAQLRPVMAPRRFRSLIRLQRLADKMGAWQAMPAGVHELWSREMSTETRSIERFLSDHPGRLPPLERWHHLLQHLFLCD